MTAKTQENPMIHWWKLFVRLQNPLMTVLLKSPLHIFVSKYYMLLTFTGRKSHKIYTTPVQYKQVGDKVWVITSRDYAWWKNLQGGAVVTMRIQGKDVIGSADVSHKAHEIRNAVELMYHSMKPQQKDELVEQVVVVQIDNVVMSLK